MISILEVVHRPGGCVVAFCVDPDAKPGRCVKCGLVLVPGVGAHDAQGVCRA